MQAVIQDVPDTEGRNAGRHKDRLLAILRRLKGVSVRDYKVRCLIFLFPIQQGSGLGPLLLPGCWQALTCIMLRHRCGRRRPDSTTLSVNTRRPLTAGGARTRLSKRKTHGSSIPRRPSTLCLSWRTWSRVRRLLAWSQSAHCLQFDWPSCAHASRLLANEDSKVKKHASNARLLLRSAAKTLAKSIENGASCQEGGGDIKRERGTEPWGDISLTWNNAPSMNQDTTLKSWSSCTTASRLPWRKRKRRRPRRRPSRSSHFYPALSCLLHAKGARTSKREDSGATCAAGATWTLCAVHNHRTHAQKHSSRPSLASYYTSSWPTGQTIGICRRGLPTHHFDASAVASAICSGLTGRNTSPSSPDSCPCAALDVGLGDGAVLLCWLPREGARFQDI